MVFSIVAQGAFVAARSAAPRQAARAFSTSLAVKKDVIQEAYLRELKSYKPQPKAADAHKEHVREFQAPKAPQAPAVPSSSDLGSELDAYAKSEPDHAERAAASTAVDGQAPEARQSIEAFLEEAKAPHVEEAHH